jgi:ubiquinone/menaquinone biosynthesis C-methylase UbiE
MSSNSYIGDIPLHYDHALGPVILAPYAAEIAAQTARRAARDVLEIAAGTGLLTRELRQRLAAGTRLIATDLSVPMLDLARKKFRMDEDVSFEFADATALPFGDASCDAVVCQFGYMFFPCKPTALREALRVLRPGGCYLFNVWDSEKYNPFASLSFEVMKELFPSDPPQFLNVPVSCAEIDPIKESLIACGFENIVVSVQKRVSDIDALSFARGLVFGTPLIDELRERGGIDPESVAQSISQALVREFGVNPTRYPMQAILFEAEKPESKAV